MLERVRRAGEALRMAEEEESGRCEMLCQTIENLRFRFAIEVNEDIAAEDEMERIADGVLLVIEVDASELDHRFQPRVRTHPSLFTAEAAEHPRFAVTVGDVAAARDGPDAVARRRQDARRDVGREDLDAPAGALRKVRTKN